VYVPLQLINYGLDDAWDELECDEEGFEALSVP
jgi:hypothetical protein